MEHYYMVTIAPPEELYPEELSPEKLEKLKAYFRTFEEAILSTEHFKSGRVHYQGIIGMRKESRVAHLKKALLTVLGYPGREQCLMDPSIRKRFVWVKWTNNLAGAIYYAMKEGEGDLVKQGMSDTWIQEQLAIAAKQRVEKKVEKRIYINDSNYERHVTDYMLQTNTPWCDLRQGLVKMHATYNFSRVRNGKSQVASLLATHCEDYSGAEECVMNWFPSAYSY